MRYFIAILLFFFSITVASAQNDTVIADITVDTVKTKVKPVKNPIIAMSLSAVIPGAGQIYNGKYYKPLIFYGAFIGVGYYYLRYQWAYSAYRNDILLMQNDSIFYKVPTTGLSDFASLEKGLNNTRRKRDLLFLAEVGVWALNIIDAYIDAELSNFDVSDDLTLSVKPYFDYYAYSPAVGLKMQIYLK